MQNFWGDKQRALEYVRVFSVVVNSSNQNNHDNIESHDFQRRTSQ